ncbi:hypothetical protein AAF712_009204 [Marasmius tenuissimus]|uniref:DUF6593 domain-containing protein n=1 Tax=Marasmius tenuissimus TaxID=585030 RepID=A0ABR2ZR64_9AGAR
MDLIYSRDNPKNATISLTTGQLVYEILTEEKTWSSEPTVIRKFQYPGHPPVEIGQVKMRSFHPDICQAWGRDIRPRKEDLLSSGRSFTSLVNGQEYNWKRKSSKAILTDKFKNTVAIYEESHSGFRKKKTPAKLSVTPGGMPILDEIVVTCVYYEQQCREDAEIAGGVGEGVGEAIGAAIAS